MPIPVYQRQALPQVVSNQQIPPSLGRAPVVRANAEAVTADKQAEASLLNQAAQASGSMARTLETLSVVGDRITGAGISLFDGVMTAQRNRDLAEAGAEMQGLIGKIKESPDHLNADRMFIEGMEEIRRKYGKGLVGQYAAQFEQALTVKAAAGLTAMKDLKHAQVVDLAVASAVEAAEAAHSERMLLSDPKERARKDAEAINGFSELAAKGLISRTRYATYKKAYYEKSAFLDAQELINQRPAKAVLVLSSAQKTAEHFPMLKPGLRLELVKRAEARQAKVEREQKEIRVTGILQEGFDRYGKNYDSILQWLENTKTRKKHGGDEVDSAWNKIISYRSASEHRQKKARETAGRALVLEVDRLRKGGEYQKAQALVDRAGPEISPTLLNSLNNTLAAWDKATGKIALGNMIAAIRGARDVLELPTDEELMRRGIRGDSLAKLINERDKRKDALKKNGGGLNFYKAAIERFEGNNSGKDDRADFKLALDYRMKVEGIDPNDPKVSEMAKAIQREMITHKGVIWDSDEPIYRVQAARIREGDQPGAVITNGQGQVTYDPDLRGANRKELAQVYQALGPDGQQAKIYRKRHALAAVRAGKTMDQVPAPYAASNSELLQMYGRPLIRRAMAGLRARGIAITPGNIDQLIRKTHEGLTR